MTASLLIEDFIAAATSAGWKIERRDRTLVLDLPVQAVRRYGAPPPSYHEFLCAIGLAASADDAVWFLCEGEYRRSDANGFAWNEIETMALEAAPDEGERRAIVSFWDGHWPIMMAPDGDYDYLAIALRGAKPGSVVHGFAPEWEDVGHVADGFDAWLAILTRSLRDPAGIPNVPFLRKCAGRRAQ